MVRNSRFKLSEELLSKLFSLFFEIMGKKSSQEEFMKVMFDLLSPAERIMLAKRVAIIYLLMKKIEYYSICDRLKVSSSTVSKFALIMEKSDGIVPTFRNIVKIEKISLFLKEIFNDIYHPGLPGTNWKSAWESKIKTNKEKIFGI
ncbi:Trp family transcriptional regulator [Patescibacteria group bacterium]|nr:Trp family transcriptional regulator [Patescibacteria group bacterium]